MLDDIKRIIKNDKETKNLKLNDDDLLVVYQYILQRDSNIHQDFIPKLILKPDVHIIYEPTKEKIKKDLTKSIIKNLETFESDIYIADTTLDDFIISDDLQQQAIDYAKQIIANKDKYMPGLYLYGSYGTGKSYLLSGLANELTKNHIDVVYAFVP